MCFSEHELVVEIDEKGHIDRNQNKENKRQRQKNVLTANFIGLILMQNNLMFLLKLVKYKITLLNQMKKKWKANLQVNCWVTCQVFLNH